MASADTCPETVMDNTAVGDVPFELQTIQSDAEFHDTKKTSKPVTRVMASEDLARHSVAELDGVIQALNNRILELEKNANVHPEGFKEEHIPPKVKADVERHRKMEACLYKHRKEWETDEGLYNDRWGIRDFEPRRYMAPTRGYREKWELNWEFQNRNAMDRPDHFHPSHNCAVDQVDLGDEAYDDFDRTIDYGDRRDRLRKNFEWELDRLYLAEEFERRKNERRDQHRQEDTSQTDTASIQESNEGEDELEIEQIVLPTFAQAKLNRVQWLSFKGLAKTVERDACVLDILIGEPDVDDDLGPRQPWYWNSRRRARKTEAPRDLKAFESTTPGQSQLPERIRIHSTVLVQILGTLLGKTLDPPDDSTIALVRPFKALRYCEKMLRDWCAALERKFGASTGTGQAATITDDSTSDQPDGTFIPHHSGPGQASPSAEELAATAGEVLSEEQEKQPSIEHQDQHERAEEGGEEVEDESPEMTKSITAMEHLTCLLAFIDTDILARQDYLKSSDCRSVFFSDLWHVFQPGTEVIGNDGKQAYRVIKVTSARHSVTRDRENDYSYPQAQRKKKAALSITCVYIDFDGKHIGPVRKIFDMKRFDGTRDISSLGVYPLRFYSAKRADFHDLAMDESETLPSHQRYRQNLVRRGAKFLNVASVKHMYYAGPTLGVRDEVESQVIIDFETAFSVEDETQKLWKPSLESLIGGSMSTEEEEEEGDEACHAACCRIDYVYDDSYVDQKQSSEYVDSLLPKANSSDQQPSVAVIPRALEEMHSHTGESVVSDEDLLIMSHRVFGFVLRNRKWAKLDLSYLSDVYRPEKPVKEEGAFNMEVNKEKREPVTAFDRLVLEEWHRPMIESLISQHFRDKRSSTGEREEFDIVKGKGKGLIILLHGAPGVGKTSTAEGVAELFKKPLFQITCGDLGTTASEVEKALETNFALASRWDCILLLDEADVFLAERTKEDFKRNGLVAVFLRVMEYYAGILFLTTNRVGDFDEAFTSRIHVSLLYPELNQPKTVEVFKINMDMIEARFNRKGRTIKIDHKGVEDFANHLWDGDSKTRWNGRQIRNACQTALALAEYEAHGKGHTAATTLQADVILNERHFKIVRDAYMDFAEYMKNLYRLDEAERAELNLLRANLTNLKDKNNQDGRSLAESGTRLAQEKAAFALGAQGHSISSQPQQSSPPPPHHQHHPLHYPTPYAQPQQQPYYYDGYQNTHAPRSAFLDSTYAQPQAQHIPVIQASNYSIAPGASTSFQGSGEEEKNMPQPQHLQHLQHQMIGPSAPRQHPNPNVQQVVDWGVHALLESTSPRPPSQTR